MNTPEGARKIVAKGIATHGSYEAYAADMRARASKGGKARVTKGFAVTGLASMAGTIGGSVTLEERKLRLKQRNEDGSIKLEAQQ